MVEAFLGIGSNLGNRTLNLEESLSTLKLFGVKILKSSCAYETEPVGFTKQGKFLNAVVKIQTLFAPHELLAICKQVEIILKRKKTYKGGPRIIDVDILLYGNKVVKSKSLTIPHKEILKRRFVLAPFAEIAPNKRHPVVKKSVKMLLSELKSSKKAVKAGKIKWT